MNILFITPSFYPAIHYGGPIYSTYGLAKALKNNGTKVRIITTNANGNEKLKFNTGKWYKLENKLPVKFYNSLDAKGTSLSMIFNLYNEIKNAEIIYLISVFSPPTPLTLLICKILNKAIIISPKGQLGKWCLGQGNSFKKIWLRSFIQPNIKLLHWHLTSKEEEKDVLSVYRNANTFVIPNGVDNSSIESRERKKDKLFYIAYSKNVTENSKIIISMGRLQNIKGFDILINAYKKVQAQVQDSVLLIAGEDFGEKSNLLSLISLQDLSGKVFLVGQIEGEEKINFLRNADLFALASHHENFGMVYAESLSAGTPIVASKNTPWQDTEKYNCGKWVENTPAKFAEAIIDVIKSDNIQMGLNGRKYIEKYFSWDKIGKEFKERIKKILNEEA